MVEDNIGKEGGGGVKGCDKKLIYMGQVSKLIFSDNWILCLHENT